MQLSFLHNTTSVANELKKIRSPESIFSITESTLNQKDKASYVAVNHFLNILYIVWRLLNGTLLSGSQSSHFKSLV